MLHVTLYTKPDCLLCDELKADLQRLAPEVGFVVEEQNIIEDPGLFARYRYLIPVLDIAGGAVLYPPHDFHAVRQALLTVRDQGPAASV